jgi:hypothetical protein
MGVQDYQVTTTGGGKLQHNGVVVHAGRLVALDSASAITSGLLTRGLITSTLTSSTHDVNAGASPNVKSTEGLTSYTVQSSGAGKILHNQGQASRPTALANGASLSLDALDEPAITLLARGWIA